VQVAAGEGLRVDASVGRVAPHDRVIAHGGVEGQSVGLPDHVAAVHIAVVEEEDEDLVGAGGYVLHVTIDGARVVHASRDPMNACTGKKRYTTHSCQKRWVETGHKWGHAERQDSTQRKKFWRKF
jgi:hypothetical protein